MFWGYKICCRGGSCIRSILKFIYKNILFYKWANTRLAMTRKIKVIQRA